MRAKKQYGQILSSALKDVKPIHTTVSFYAAHSMSEASSTKALSAHFHTHELTDMHDWLVLHDICGFERA